MASQAKPKLKLKKGDRVQVGGTLFEAE